jgi:hypothetical protein
VAGELIVPKLFKLFSIIIADWLVRGYQMAEKAGFNGQTVNYFVQILQSP